MIPFITSRTSTWRLLPPRLAGGINDSTCVHSSSVRSLGYRSALRSYRLRFFAVHIGDPPRIRPPLLNHKRFKGFNMFSDRHLAHDAFTDYRQYSVQLSRQAATAISKMLRGEHVSQTASGLSAKEWEDRLT